MQVLTIGKVARRAEVGVETVRFYERRGLIAEPPAGLELSVHARLDPRTFLWCLAFGTNRRNTLKSTKFRTATSPQALFGLALSLPLVLAVLFPPAARALDRFAALSRRMPLWTGLLLIALGLWSIGFALFAEVTP
jgi:hypothetical protein